MIKKIFNYLLSLIFPIECISCKEEDTYLCTKCLNKIDINHDFKFKKNLKYIDKVHSATKYDNKLLQIAIHYFKFRYIKELVVPLSKIIIKYLEQEKIELTDYMLIPIPLHKKRYLERGFNQSELIATQLAKHFNLQIANNVLIRSLNTPHQVGLNKKKRLNNLNEAFKVLKPELIKDKKIILIDDVVTTGSTLEEVAKTLIKAKVSNIIAITIAYD